MPDGLAGPSIGAVLRRLLKQSWLAIVLAVVWACFRWTVEDEQARSVASWFTWFAAAFFFLMWLGGQYFRVAKHVSDEVRLSEIHTELVSIRKAMQEEALARGEPPAAEPHALPIADAVAAELLAEADQAMDGNLGRSALLTASVALEHSIRRFAERAGLGGRRPGGRISSIPELLRSMKELVGTGVAAEIGELWRIRNALAHPGPEVVDSNEEARRILDSIRLTVSHLSTFEPRSTRSPAEG